MTKLCLVTTDDITCVLKRRNHQNNSHGIKIVTPWNSFDVDNCFEEDIQPCCSSGTLFLSKNKDFDNGNSQRMMEQEDILPCYIKK